MIGNDTMSSPLAIAFQSSAPSASTPAGPAKMAALARPMNKPRSTTPGMKASARASASTSAIAPKRAVENVMAAVADEQRAGLTAQRQRAGEAERGGRLLDAPDRRSDAERDDLDRQGKASELRDRLLESAMTTMRRDDAATIFSRSSAPPPPLIRRSAPSISSAPSTVRSSSGVSSRVVNGIPSSSRLARRRFRGRHADDLEALANLSADEVDEKAGGRAGAETKLHARPDEIDRPFRRLPLVGLAARQFLNSATGGVRPPAAMA